MLRLMAGFGLVAVGHLILSAMIVLAFAVAGEKSSEAEQWLLVPFGYGLFFPALTAMAMGADLEAASPAGLVFAFIANSLCWTSLVYPICAYLRSRAQTRKRRTESSRRRKEEAAWWADFFDALSSESQEHAEPDAAPDRRA
jgi:hypothetical protein